MSGSAGCVCTNLPMIIPLYSSLSRFIAVSIPLTYNRKHVDQRQIVLLSATWLLALAVACPVMFGINNVPGRDRRECKLEDDNYVVYSSVCSFFIPCPIMLLLYCAMFRGLRRWEESRKAKLKTSIEVCRKLQHAAAVVNAGNNTNSSGGGGGSGLAVRGTIPGPLPMPLPRIIERDLAQTRLEEMEDCMDPKLPYPRQYRENSVPTVSYHHQHRKKRAKINGRERKAMRVLPVVVGKWPHTLPTLFSCSSSLDSLIRARAPWQLNLCRCGSFDVLDF